MSEKKVVNLRYTYKIDDEPCGSPRVYTNLGGGQPAKMLLNPFAQKPTKTETVKDMLSQFCSQCNQQFANASDYAQHVKDTHPESKAFKCEICQTEFTREAHLKRHILCQHPDPKYCHCPVCFKTFRRQDALKLHIKTKHSNTDEVFHCRACTHTCSNIKDLREHEITHTMSERHQCPDCNMTFKRRDHMLRHIKCQHLNQSVECPVCKQKYKRSDHVFRHMREKHKINVQRTKRGEVIKEYH